MQSPTSPKILFLDIDGVLNSAEWVQYNTKGSLLVASDVLIDERAVELLNELRDIPNLEVVVSSFWRRDEDCRQKLVNKGLKLPFHKHWRTPDIRADFVHRTEEVSEWMFFNKPVSDLNVVVLDDMRIYPPLEHRWVQTEYETGLGNTHIHRIRTLLSND